MLPYARLVADDRVRISAAHGRLIVAAPETIQGVMEVHSLGLRSFAFEPVAVAGWIVDLAATDAARMPEKMSTELLGVTIPRLPVGAREDPFPIVIAALTTSLKG